MVANWTLEPGKYGARLVMHEPWSSSALHAVQQGSIRELELNYSKGWAADDYSFLRQIPELWGLEVTDWNASDVSAINDLRNLRQLKIFTYCKTEIHFSRFPLLEDCSLEWRSKASSLFAHQGVKKVFVNKCPLKDLRPLATMTSLESLSLASPKLETLQGIEALTKLMFLGLYVARRLVSLDGVQAVPNLVHLEVNDCPKIRDIAPVGALSQLQKLHLCNDGELLTIKPLRELKELEQFLFYESTNVLDGDLSPLESLPKLRDVTFMDRKHYTHRRADFPSITT